MTGLTKITTPFGLLDAETQEALQAHGGPFQCWLPEDGWRSCPFPAWVPDGVYRVKPQPPKPREWWILCGCEAYDSKQEAEEAKATLVYAKDRPIIHVREVLPE